MIARSLRAVPADPQGDRGAGQDRPELAALLAGAAAHRRARRPAGEVRPGRRRLRTLVAEKPDRIDAALTLADLLRGKERYADAVQAYDTAIQRLRNIEERHWPMFFGRGIVLERIKQWPKAEADMKKALELSPEQPHVLNYLGYSWIDQGLHLDDGMKMLQRATELRPDDGAITDLGRLGVLPARPVRQGRRMAGARERAEGRRRHHRRASGRRLLACRPQARGALPNGSARSTRSPTRTACR